MSKLFLSLDDAVKVAQQYCDMDEEVLKSEFEQKCYISNDQYSIGYEDAIEDACNALRKLEVE